MRIAHLCSEGVSSPLRTPHMWVHCLVAPRSGGEFGMAGVIRVNLIGALGDQDLQNTFAWVGDAAILADALLLAEWLGIKLAQYFDANMTTGLLYGRAVTTLWEAV